ncbi:MAG: hypothetical protein NTAFB01_13320 [Nitrospira sp.]
MANRAHSSIDKLGVQELVGHLFEVPGTTYEHIIDKVREATGQRLTKSSLSRYHATWADAQKQIELARKDADVITAMLKAHPEMNFTDSAMAMLLGKLVRRFAHAQDSFETVPLDKLSHLLVKVARAQQATEVLRIQSERLALLQQRVQQAAEKVADAAKSKGLDDDTLKQIREEIYGIAA